MLDFPAEKRCRSCEAIKPCEAFYRSARTVDRRGSYCKVCVRKTSREWAADNPEQHREAERIRQARYRARKKAVGAMAIQAFRIMNELVRQANELVRQDTELLRAANAETEEWKRRCVEIVRAVGRAEGTDFRADWNMSEEARQEVLAAVEAAEKRD